MTNGRLSCIHVLCLCMKYMHEKDLSIINAVYDIKLKRCRFTLTYSHDRTLGLFKNHRANVPKIKLITFYDVF